MEKMLQLKQFVPWAKAFLLFVLLLLIDTTVSGQERTITGTVTDQMTHETLPGASILIKGTTNGVSTDINGKFSLKVTPNDKILEVSFIGYESTEITIGAQNVINVQLLLKHTTLDEVVVVGYGTSKVKDLTSAISTVKSDELLKTPSSQPMNAMQGKVAGLQVVTNGAPGSSATIRIRGIGSFPGRSNEAPLYVVDGVFYDNIDFLNPADIASISVLKDASASAIYGVRAANGVVLIETKSGSYNQKTHITYDGYMGYQVAQNVVKMANAEQFVTMANESGSAPDIQFVQNAMQRYGRSRINPNLPDVNTDWYNEVIRPGKIQNHSLGFDGGTDKAKYSVGVNYFAQEGLLKAKNEYERLNIRTKVDIKATSWLNVGGNFLFSNATQYNNVSNAWYTTYFAVPILPVYDPSNTAAWPTDYANAQDLGYRDGQNPFPSLDNTEDRVRIEKLLATMYLEFTLIPKTLTFKSTYNNNFTFLNERNTSLSWFIGNSFQNKDAVVTKTTKFYPNYAWDNILTFTKSFSKHNLVVMAGSSYKDENYQMLTAQGLNFDPNHTQSWYINQSLTKPSDAVDDDGLREYGLSYFGRVAYNYSEKYLIYATMRADGSSKYQQKWGYFPTVGAGWVISEEKFLKNNDAVPYLKLRASWGQLGNDQIQASDGAATTTVVITTMGSTVVSGTWAASTYSELKWEVTQETNLGLTARFLKGRLTSDIDYYIRDTKNAAIPVNIPLIGGSVLRPVGTIRNSGIEIALNWADKITDKLNYTVGVNIATLKNEVRDLYGQPYLDGGTAEFRQRSYVGDPLMEFYGWKVAGVYQTQDECDHDIIAIENHLVPGDLKFVDQNNDFVIDGNDRVPLGSYFPSLTYGFNLGISYLNFDFSANFYGQYGNKILNRKRGQMIWTNDGNIDADLATNRWHGEGTSNLYPSSAGLRKGWNQKMSDYFVEDGSFWRIQNVQIGYNIKQKSWLNGNFPSTRIFFTAERPLTVFKYNGFTPEVANGFDDITYPIPAVYTVGLNVNF